jgi:hypothetical protein
MKFPPFIDKKTAQLIIFGSRHCSTLFRNWTNMRYDLTHGIQNELNCIEEFRNCIPYEQDDSNTGRFEFVNIYIDLMKTDCRIRYRIQNPWDNDIKRRRDNDEYEYKHHTSNKLLII